MRRYQPPAMPGWGPMSTPPRTPQLWPKVAREAAIFGGLALAAIWTGVLASPAGWLIVFLARAILDLLINHRHDLGLPALKFLAVGALAAAIAFTVPHGPAVKVTAPPLKAPAQVEASQADYLEQARKIWADAYAQTLGRGASKPLEPKKEGR